MRRNISMKKLYNSVKNNYEKLVIPIIVCIVLFLTIGYSAISNELGISQNIVNILNILFEIN